MAEKKTSRQKVSSVGVEGLHRKYNKTLLEFRGKNGFIEYLANKDNNLTSFSLELRLGRLSEGNRNEYIADLLSRIPQGYVHKETIPPNRDKPGCYHIVIERRA